MVAGGQCLVCSEKETAKNMRTHILGHLEGKSDTNGCLVRVTNPGAIMYWIYVRISKKAKLSDLDDLLRSTWVECCDHLSSFRTKGASYDSMLNDMMPGESRSMDVSAVRVLTRHRSLVYEYDFGTTTSLVVKLACSCSGAGMEQPAELVARNLDIPFDCSGCGKKGGATTLCTFCMKVGKDCMLCDKCVGRHEHGDDDDPVDEAYFLPVVNSPRMGMCGYTG